MPKAIWTTQGYWLCQGGRREVIMDADDMAKACDAYGKGILYPHDDGGGFPAPQLDVAKDKGGAGWTWDEIDRLLGRPYEESSGGGEGGGLAPHVHSLDAPGANTGPAITD